MSPSDRELPAVAPWEEEAADLLILLYHLAVSAEVKRAWSAADSAGVCAKQLEQTEEALGRLEGRTGEDERMLKKARGVFREEAKEYARQAAW